MNTCMELCQMEKGNANATDIHA